MKSYTDKDFAQRIHIFINEEIEKRTKELITKVTSESVALIIDDHAKEIMNLKQEIKALRNQNLEYAGQLHQFAEQLGWK